jgi:hypothetical protein
MENIGYIEETLQDKKPQEIESCKVPVCSCTNHSANGPEDCCKSGAFLVPLCVVI